MPVEYVLAITMMWVSPQGQTRGEAMNGTYATHQACTQAIINRVEFMRRVHGVAPVPTGTELCVPREKRQLSPSDQAFLNDLQRFVDEQEKLSEQPAPKKPARK